VSVVGCGEPPTSSDVVGGTDKAEATQSALTGVFTTVPGQNKAESSYIYSCAGWVYRMLFSWEQHADAGSPTGWYAAIGPSSVATTGTVLNDVSADAYLQCYWGILPSDHATDSQGRSLSGRLYVDMSANPAPCTLRTVWPTSWHLPDVLTPVFLNAYDYVPGIGSNTSNGIISLGLSSPYAANDPGRGWCGDGWTGVTVTNVSKLPLPAPAVMPAPKYTAHLCSAVNDETCLVDPPCDVQLPASDPSSCSYTPSLPL
jgi:hypothetical protein